MDELSNFRALKTVMDITDFKFQLVYVLFENKTYSQQSRPQNHFRVETTLTYAQNLINLNAWKLGTIKFS